jgi:hypothetical protein
MMERNKLGLHSRDILVAFSSFNDTVNNSGYKASSDGVKVNYELDRMWKETPVT